MIEIVQDLLFSVQGYMPLSILEFESLSQANRDACDSNTQIWRTCIATLLKQVPCYTNNHSGTYDITLPLGNPIDLDDQVA